MNATQLAEQFDETARSLETNGHLIIVRRARSFLDEGRPDLAATFLVEATRRMPGSPIRALSEALQNWRRNEGDLDALLAQPQWTTSADRENSLSDAIRSRTQDLGHQTLLSVLTGDAPEQGIETYDEISPNEAAEWVEDELTSEVFEAPSTIYQRPTLPVNTPPTPETKALPDPLIVGVIVMLQALTIYFCFFRPS